MVKESQLVKQARARNNATRDAVGLGTEIVLDNMRHPKKQSNFASSTLGLAIIDQNQRNQQLTNQVVNNVKQMSKKVDTKIATLKAKHGKNYNISAALAKQQQLVKAGYDIEIDGDWGKQSEAAWQDYQSKKPKQGDTVTFDDVKQDPQFIEYLYKSGGENAPILRKTANGLNVGLNYVHGLMFPGGNTLYDLGEGTERQAVAASLWDLQNGHLTGKGTLAKTGSITDAAHEALGGRHGNSGKSFRDQNKVKGLFNKVIDQAKNAINLPYHNIYGQSSDGRFDSEGFHSYGDNYTFNNVWGRNKKGKIAPTKQLKDGEGDMSLWESLGSGYDAYSNGVSSIQALMETIASNRGVNTKRHKDVSDISREDLDRWAQEYVESQNK